MEIFTKNARETQRAGEEFANSLKSLPAVRLSSSASSSLSDGSTELTVEVLGVEDLSSLPKGSPSKSGRQGGIVLALSGNLGSGKTTFIQGLAKGLGVKQRIISPTFILLREYEISNFSFDLLESEPRSRRPELRTEGQFPISKFYHIDLYRLENNVEQELRNLGIEEVWGKRENIVAIEWAEKVKRMLPRNTVRITFENLDGDKRRITIK